MNEHYYTNNWVEENVIKIRDYGYCLCGGIEPTSVKGKCDNVFFAAHFGLFQDEEWLSGFQEVLGRSVALTESVCSLLDNFQERIDSLSTNVSTLVAKSSVIQKEQQSEHE